MKHGHGARRGVWTTALVAGTVLAAGGAYAAASVTGSHSSRTGHSRPIAAAPSPSALDTTESAVPSPPQPSPTPSHRRKPHVTASPTTTTGHRTTGGNAPQQPTAPGGTAGRYAQQVVSLVNAQRGQNGCGPLSVNPKLTLAAQRQSDDMATRHFFSHTNPDGADPGTRISATGYRWSTWGENIAYGQRTPAEVMDAWMNSPGHRANILNCSFQEIGVGVNLDSGSPYWTQDFGAP